MMTMDLSGGSTLRPMALTAGFCMTFWLAAGSPAIANEDTVIDYPESGVELGQGWNSFSVEKTTATCIVFQEARVQSQKKNMTMRAVTSRYQLDRELGISASASYKGIAGSISGKASYASSAKIETSGTTVAALARVDNGNISVSPPKDGYEARVAELITAGKTPEEINAAIGETATEVGERLRQILPDLASDDIDKRHRAFDIKKINAAAVRNGTAGTIRLAREFEDLAKNDPAKFRKVCGDSYVATISQGGDLAMLFNFETKSIKKQQDIAAELQGSGWGVTAAGSMKNKVASVSEGTKTTLTYNQTGGSGDPIPTNLDELYDKIKTFPGLVEKSPFNYSLQLARYEELINWPAQKENPHASYQAIDKLIYSASVWKQLDNDLTTILNDSSDPFGIDGYLLGRGVKRAVLLDKQEEVRENLSAVEGAIKACLADADASPPCDPVQKLSKLGTDINALTAAEMEVRVLLPLPIKAVPNPPERFQPAENLREQLYQIWIQKVNVSRCNMGGSVVCLSNKKAEAYKARIKVDPTPVFVILSNKLNRACIKPDAPKKRLNLSEGCALDKTDFLFRWDAGKRHLVHDATKKCVNVRGGSKSEGADIILFKCQGAGKKYANDRWSLSHRPEWIQLKNQKSNKCITVTGELRPGRRLTQSDCSKGPGKSLLWRFQMQ